MEIGIWIIGSILVGIILLLLCKILAMCRAAREIGRELADKLGTETNTLITVGTRDRTMRNLAQQINVELRRLRTLRHRYERGNLAVKETITNASHDIRTPLTAIYGYLELLEQEDKSEAVERYLSIIRNRTEALRELTEELFVYAVSIPSDAAVHDGNDTGVIDLNVPVDMDHSSCILNRVLEESISAYYGALKMRQITPEISMPEEKVVRKLNPRTLSRIFANVLSNAVKYSDGDLQIRLSEAGEVTFANHASNLDEIQVGRLFDRFYTVENAEHATGLGLSIARVLTEQSGGSIAAQYEDKMLTIRIMFPV